MQIEINYKNPQKPRGVVNNQPVPLNSTFSFFSLDGKLEVEFLNDSPVKGDEKGKRHPDRTDFVAFKPGRFEFRCFIDGEPVPEGGGGVLLVPDGM